MPEAGFAEKTEPATGKRRMEVRRRGQVARSMDLNTALALLAACGLFWGYGGVMWRGLSELTMECLRLTGERDLGAGDLRFLLFSLGVRTVILLVPVLLIMFVVAVVSNALQVGFAWASDRFTLNLEVFNPVTGLSRMFSFRSFFRLLTGFLKLLVIGVGLYWILSRRMFALLGLTAQPVMASFEYAKLLSLQMAVTVALLLLVLALLDYAYQRWTFERDIRMTKQEVKDELKEMEGDPKIKMRRLRVMRQLATQRMMQQVPQADVVITNPTHYAIAVQYHDGMRAPRVLAKGTDLLAQRIREKAVERGIPVVERPGLAQAMYRAVEVGEEIPEKFWQAVAEVLAYVYQLAGSPKGAYAS